LRDAEGPKAQKFVRFALKNQILGGCTFKIEKRILQINIKLILRSKKPIEELT